MRLDSKTTIAAQSAVRVRNFLRRSGSDLWGLEFVQRQLGIDRPTAQALVDELVHLGFVQQASEFSDGPYWRMTQTGSTFSLATAAKPVRRQTADKAVSAFLQRVREVNNQPRFLYQVAKVEVFGSYLTGTDRLGDVDLAVTLKPKESNANRREAIENDHIERAIAAGRRFQNIVDQLFWPQYEVLQYLKARSRVLSLHAPDDPVKLGVKMKVIYRG
jgi:hypothetical protein